MVFHSRNEDIFFEPNRITKIDGQIINNYIIICVYAIYIYIFVCTFVHKIHKLIYVCIYIYSILSYTYIRNERFPRCHSAFTLLCLMKSPGEQVYLFQLQKPKKLHISMVLLMVQKSQSQPQGDGAKTLETMGFQLPTSTGDRRISAINRRNPNKNGSSTCVPKTPPHYE